MTLDKCLTDRSAQEQTDGDTADEQLPSMPREPDAHAVRWCCAANPEAGEHVENWVLEANLVRLVRAKARCTHANSPVVNANSPVDSQTKSLALSGETLGADLPGIGLSEHLQRSQPW